MINGCVPLAELILLFFIPESPYWLITKKRPEEAKKNLAWLRGWTSIDNVEQEFSDICYEIEQKENGRRKNLVSFESLKQYTKLTFIKPFLLICFSFVLAHFGTTQINIYAVKIFQLLKVPIDSYYATVLIGSVELLSCILLMLSIRFLGKRVLTFIAQLGISLCFLLAGVYTYSIGVTNFDSTSDVNEDIANHYNWVPLFSIVSVGFFSYLMTYSLPWIIMGEIFPNDIRDTATGLSAGTGYIIGFLANKTFLNLVNVATLAGVFWLYSAVALIGFVAMYFLLPETEGKPLIEITEHYAGRGKLSNKVKTKNETGIITGGGIANKGFENNEVNTRL